MGLSKRQWEEAESNGFVSFDQYGQVVNGEEK
jgi:hypothetical protein